MMSLRKAVNINWNGKQYSILVTMEVIERLEEKVNLVTMATQANSRDLRFSHAAKLIAAFLNEGGANVTTEEVYAGMFGGGDVTPAQLGDMMREIFAVVFPEPKKKAESLPTTPPKTKSSRATGSHGRSSTKR